MKLMCKTIDIIEAVNAVQKAVSIKSNNDILEGILIESYDNIKLTGYDNKIGIEYLPEGSILKQGAVVVNSKLFGEIIRKLPHGDVFIELKENVVYIDCALTHYELSGIEPSDYPKLPLVEKNEAFCINEDVLKDLIRQTIFAISIDENRKNMMGSLFEVKGDSLTVVSIDGFRLALAKTRYIKQTTEFSVVVPGYALNQIIKILEQEQNKVELYVSQNLMAFETGRCKIVTRLIELDFLKYQNFIPHDYDTSVIVKTEELLMSLDRASLIGTEDKKYPVKFSITENELIITSSATAGNVKEIVDVKVIGSSMVIGFNPRFFMDALKVINDEEIEIRFSSTVGPAIIRPLSEGDFLHMVLPVQLSDTSSEG